MTTSYTPTVTTPASLLENNALGRKFQDPTKCDAPVFVRQFSYKNNTGGTLADGTIVNLGPILGPGIILPMGFVGSTALGASRVLNLGFNSYSDTNSGAVKDGKINSLVSALDVSSATSKSFRECTSDTVNAGVEIFGPTDLLLQITGGTIPDQAVISGSVLISKVM